MKKGDRSETIQTPNEDMERIKNRLRRKSGSENTVLIFEFEIKQFLGYMRQKNYNYSDIEKKPTRVMEDFVSWLYDSKYTPSTIQLYFGAARLLLKEHDIKLTDDDVKDIGLPKRMPFDDEKVSVEQIRRIVFACKHSGLKILLMLMKDTMIRPRECVGLQLKHFNLEYEIPYLIVPYQVTKSKETKELFFTYETKDMLVQHLKANRVDNPDDYVFLRKNYKYTDEKDFNKILNTKVRYCCRIFRYILQKPEFADMNQVVDRPQTRSIRYKIHPYSFKKFAYTAISDVLSEAAVKSMKGDTDYALTYYKKSRDERMEDYKKVISKLSVFDSSEDPLLKQKEKTKLLMDNATPDQIEKISAIMNGVSL